MAAFFIAERDANVGKKILVNVVKGNRLLSREKTSNSYFYNMLYNLGVECPY